MTGPSIGPITILPAEPTTLPHLQDLPPSPPLSPKPASIFSLPSNEDGSDEDESHILHLHHDASEPTSHDLATLRRVPATIPRTAFIIALVELCERFAFYGLSGPFQNYISNGPSGADGNPGALGLGQSWATGLTSVFSCWCYLTSVFGAIVADQYVGKYRAIVGFAGIYLVGLVILVLSSTDASINSGWALWGLLAAMGVIGLGTGGIKANVAPLIAEQVTEERVRVKVIENGERVLVDPKLTVQRIYMVFYLCINVGSLSGIITTYMEHHTGFWSAYMLATVFFILGLVVLVWGRKMYVVKRPQGSVVANAIRVMALAWKEGKGKRGLEGTKPSKRSTLGLTSVPWTDAFVDDVAKALRACKVLLFFPLYYTVFFQMMNNFVSQAGTMELHGIPNDLMSNIDPITIILFIPLLDHILYPFLRRRHIPLLPTTRITLGFALGTLAMIYAAWIQHRIYLAPPCYTSPLTCPAAKTPDGHVQHNQVHVLMQTPAYVLIALSEILAGVTGLEYAYMQAPASMKSVVQSVFLLMTAAGAAVSAAVAPWARDPWLTYMYLALALVSAISGGLFWRAFGGHDDAVEGKKTGGGTEEEEIMLGRMSRDED